MAQANDTRPDLRRRPAGTSVVAALEGEPERVVEFAYLRDHERPDGEHRIMPIPETTDSSKQRRVAPAYADAWTRQGHFAGDLR